MSIENLSIHDCFKEIDEKNWKTNKIYDNVLSITSYNPNNYMEIVSLNWNLDDKYNYILAAIVYHDQANIDLISNTILAFDGEDRSEIWEKQAFYTKIRRGIIYLLAQKLITISSKSDVKNLGNKKIFYKLSLNGLFYVIINCFNNPFASIHFALMFNKIIKNYSDTPLLRIFLNPYFQNNTLENATDDLSFELLEYLSEICKIIIANKRGTETNKNSLIDGAQPEHMFTWPTPNNVFTWPTPNQIRRDRFVKFFEKGSKIRQLLCRELKWYWIDEAQIIPQLDTDIITIKSHHLSTDAFIKINKEEKIVTLINGKAHYSFFRMYINEDKSISVFGKSTIDENQISEEHLHYLSNLKLVELIFSIRTKNKGKDNDLYISVKKDKRFKTVMREMVDLLMVSE